MADDAKIIDEAVEKFRSLMESQLARAKKIKEDKDFTDYDALDTIVIGICGGDGIGPIPALHSLGLFLPVRPFGIDERLDASLDLLHPLEFFE